MVSLIKVSSAPGSTFEKVLKVFETRKIAKEWLFDEGYIFNKNVKCWEHPNDEDDFVWTYVKIKSV